MASGGGYHTKSRGLREISHSEIHHREFDLAQPPLPSSPWICAHPHAVAATAGPTMRHGARDTWAVVHWCHLTVVLPASSCRTVEQASAQQRAGPAGVAAVRGPGSGELGGPRGPWTLCSAAGRYEC